MKKLKLDLGCGKNPREGFTGVDRLKFGQQVVADLTKKWPWRDGSVEEVHSSHFVEHLTAEQRVHFVNELYRVLQKGGKATIITPHWNNARAYGDLTHQWPPVSEWWFLYLNKEWREVNAPHSGYKPEVDFQITHGYAFRPDLGSRPEEYRNYAMANYRDALIDIHSNWVKP